MIAVLAVILFAAAYLGISIMIAGAGRRHERQARERIYGRHHHR